MKKTSTLPVLPKIGGKGKGTKIKSDMKAPKKFSLKSK